MDALWVLIGGALGSWARWSVGRAMTEWLGPHVPVGTFAVNVLGSALLGAFAAHARAHDVAAHWRLFVATGLCGGFTTYSSFNLELVQQIEVGAWARAAAYAAATFVTCLLAGLGGAALTRAI